MLKKIVSLFIFVSIATPIFAAQCPPSTVFSHVKDQPWTVNAKTSAEGWVVYLSNDDAISSELTHLERETEMEATLTLYWFHITEAACFYILKSGSPDYVAIVNKRHQVDMKQIPQPPFTGKNPYHCDTNSATAEVCAWKWLLD